MRIVHTSDWHLGKKLYRASRIDEQHLFLTWLSDYLITNKVDILLISGDVFDVPTPPNEALKHYFNFLKELTTKSHIQIFIIGGNHDSSHFLEAPSPFLKLSGIHVIGNLTEFIKGNIEPYLKEVTIAGETTTIVMLPYFRTHELYNLGKKWDIDPELGLLPVIEKCLSIMSDSASGKKILMAHHLFGSYEESGSEQGLSLSGIDSIPTAILEDFDYVALGHIHKAQTLRKETPIIHYSGSPMSFRFSETTTKTMSQIEISNGKLTNELIEIKQFDKLLRVNCNYQDLDIYKDEVISSWKDQSDIKVYLEMKVKTSEPIASLAEKLREEFSENGITLLSFQTIVIDNSEKEEEEHFLEKSLRTEELFDMYYKKKYPESEEVPRPLREDFYSLLESVRGDLDEA
ncbi:hypothetical protein A9Q84_15885 [Halobacteriovorax marinus]|uniref:Nuclease SbcCD subunit D n=1 Tax=Halobacteriovorax marinus TaxID=97084 RepID=A0A1Y5F431_9BACT|nr:hypothetical protein A9Q84_15885 [Halobacteriovorax marinus]